MKADHASQEVRPLGPIHRASGCLPERVEYATKTGDFRLADLPERIQRNIRVSESGCWEWVGSRQPRGYGTASFHGRPVSAHRHVYTLLVGEIPAGLEIDHLCLFKSCVNPAHLEPVTRTENQRRAQDARPPRTHCKSGLHEWAAPHLKTRADGHTICKTCTKGPGRPAGYVAKNGRVTA